MNVEKNNMHFTKYFKLPIENVPKSTGARSNYYVRRKPTGLPRISESMN